MIVPCFVCRRQVEHFFVGYVGEYPLCCYCYQTYRSVNLSSLQACQSCRRLFKPADLIISRNLVLCRGCFSVTQAIKDRLPREPIIYRSEEDYWVEVKLWLMLLDAMQETSEGGGDYGRQNGAGSGSGCVGSETVAAWHG